MLFCEHYQDVIGQLLRHLYKEVVTEIRHRSTSQERDADQFVHVFPDCAVKLAPGKPTETDAGLAHMPPVAACFLALLRTEVRKKFVERTVASVMPMKLTVLANFHTRFFEGYEFVFARKQHMQR